MRSHKALVKITAILAIALLCASAAPAKTKKTTARKASASTVAAHKSGKKSLRSKRAGKSAKARRSRGQQGIAPERAREIQQALIEAKYLEGAPSGVWDSRTKEAMARFQADHGWQTKVLPDSRALIKLGLGPNHKDIFSPERTSISQPAFGSESDTPPGTSQLQH